KTHALVGVVLQHLLCDRPGHRSPVEPARIVATTFSRKAAAEIRTRVTAELERLARAPQESHYVEDLRDALAQSGPADELIVARARHALERVGAARFGTLHSFATGLVQTYAFELGLGARFELATESDARMRDEDAIAHALEQALASKPEAVRSLSDAAGG